MIAFAALALAETILKVTSGEMTGHATVLKRMLDDGSKYVRLDLTLARSGGKEVHVVQESTYRADGTPVNLSQKVEPSGSAVTAVFGPTEVVLTTDGREKHIAYPDGTVKATPEFWVVRDRPKAGTRVTYQRLDLVSGHWVATPCEYKGVAKIDGKTVHRLKLGDTLALLDDAGDPVRIESGPTVMTRG